MRRRSYRKSARVMWWGFVAWSVLVIVSVLDARFRLRVHGGFLVNFDEWESAIIRAYKDAPATYQTAYAAWLKSTLGTGLPKDHAGLFLAGWLAACDALANRLVGWLDEPAGDDVSAFLGFVEELRKGDLS